jgi:hypothetical protein
MVDPGFGPENGFAGCPLWVMASRYPGQSSPVIAARMASV